jgi:hypothetical protein
VFSKIPRSRVALETRTHSAWVSRQLTQLRHEVIVVHAYNVRLIGESRALGSSLLRPAVFARFKLTKFDLRHTV